MPGTTSSTTRWLLVMAAAVGVAIGIAAYTFVYAEGASYLTNDPAACANCHVMSEHYSAWLKASHRAVATCNDCHTPHGLVAKYATKASNGFWHSFAFTTGRFPDPLRIKPGNRRITERACRTCHEQIVASIDAAAHAGPGGERGELSCIRCHVAAGHWVR